MLIHSWVWLIISTHISISAYFFIGFPGGTAVRKQPASEGDTEDPDSILGLERSPGGGHGYPLQYCCLENSMDRGDWWVTTHRLTKGWTWLSDWAHIHTYLFIESHVFILVGIKYIYMCMHREKNTDILCKYIYVYIYMYTYIYSYINS